VAAVLASIPLFSGLDATAREVVERHSALRSVRRNTVVIQKGDESGVLYVVISGRLKVSVADEQGKEVILNTLGSGDYFGELAILGDMPRTATVVSLEDSNLLTLSRTAFLELVREQPDVALAVIRNLTARVAQLTEQVGRLALGDVYSRIRDLLNAQAFEEDGLLVTARFTQSEIAQMVGSSREMVSRIFKDLREGGYIRLDDRRVVILRKLPTRW
jgi:CRP/FNR family cyclic AMP-dependent transcriptional regulator